MNTDTDAARLRRAFTALRKAGIYARMNIPSCGAGCCPELDDKAIEKFCSKFGYTKPNYPSIGFTRRRGPFCQPAANDYDSRDPDGNIDPTDPLCLHWGDFTEAQYNLVRETIEAEGLPVEHAGFHDKMTCIFVHAHQANPLEAFVPTSVNTKVPVLFFIGERYFKYNPRITRAIERQKRVEAHKAQMAAAQA